MFYMNMRAFNEGEQAEAYKKRKAEEEARKENERKERDKRRYGSGSVGDRMTRYNPNHYDYKGDKEKNIHGVDKMINSINGKIDDMDRKEIANEKLHRNSDIYDDKYDAINRHLRRHPKNECGIFESVEII